MERRTEAGRSSVYGGGSSSEDKEGGWGIATGDCLMIPAACEISSRPSMRPFNRLIFSSNFFASQIAHLAIERNDFCL